MSTALKILIRVILVYCAVVFFNLFLGVYLWLPGFDFYWITVPLPESAAAVMLLVLLADLSAKKPESRLPHRLLLLFTLVFLVFQIFIILEAFFRHVYQRPFQIAGNLQLASGFFNMLFRTDVFSYNTILALSASAVFLLLFIIFMFIFRLLLPFFGKIAALRSVLILFPAILLSLYYIPGPSAAERFIDQMGNDSFQYERNNLESSLKSVSPLYVFPGIEDRNIHLFIAESYGMTIFTNPHHYRRLKDFYISREEMLKSRGFYVYTSGYNSTAFGGMSWLADATILTGVNINTQSLYNKIVKETAEPNLLHLLKNKGYTTILSAPGTKFMTPEYTGFYDFSKYVIHDDFGYEGPYFTYGDMPDQYQLYHTQTRVIAPEFEAEQLLFVKYILCSSHVPWNYIPPYIENWSGFDSGKIYFNRSRNTWYDNSWAVGSELFEGYTHSIQYTLETVTGYIVNYLGDNDIAIIIGDHQPKFPVSEKGSGPGVPVHIAAKDENLLIQFSRIGYNRGFLPAETENLPGLEKFLRHFLYIADGSMIDLNAEDDLY